MEDILGMGGMGKEFVQTLNHRDGYKITLDWVNNGKDAVDCYQKSKKPNNWLVRTFCCCAAQPQAPYDLIVMDIEIPDSHGSSTVNSYGGVKAAKEIRKLGYKGPICAVMCYSDQFLFKLKVESPELFITWGGKIGSCEELQHMLCNSGQRFSSIPKDTPNDTPTDTPIVGVRTIKPPIINQEVVYKPERPLTPRPQDLTPPMDDRLAQGQYAISTGFVQLNTPIQLESGCKDVVLKKTDQLSQDTSSKERVVSEKVECPNAAPLQAAITSALSAEINKPNLPIHPPRNARDAIFVNPCSLNGIVYFRGKQRIPHYHVPIRISSTPSAMSVLIKKSDVKMPRHFISRRHFLIARLGRLTLEKQNPLDPKKPVN